METVFEKNLKLLKTYNPLLCEKLKNTYNYDSFSLNTNLAGEYNLIENGRPVHSVTGAQKEAEEAFSEVKKDTQNVIHLIYGLGLGYTGDIFANNAKGTVVVYESNTALIKYVLEIVDLTESQDFFYIVNSIEELDLVYAEIYKYNTITEITALDYHKTNFKNELKNFTANANTIQTKFINNYKYQAANICSFCTNMLERLGEKSKLPLLFELKDCFKNTPAIIVSAGPSLNRCIEEIRQYQGRALIFSVGTAFKTLAQNNITPDFVNYIERVFNPAQFEGINLENINLIAEPSANSKILDLNFKRKFLTISHETNSNHLFAELNGINKEYCETKGTVAYHALYCAKILGCSPIVLAGQDLAFTEGQCYSKGSAFEDLICTKDPVNGSYRVEPKDYENYKKVLHKSRPEFSEEEIVKATKKYINNINQSIVFTKGVNNEMLPTTYNYKQFIGYFEDFARRNLSEIDLYNASNGAKIEGFKSAKITDVIKDSTGPSNIEAKIEALINDKEVSSVLAANLRKNRESLQKMIPVLQNYLEKAEHADYETTWDLIKSVNNLRAVNSFAAMFLLNEFNEFVYYLKEIYGTQHTQDLDSLHKKSTCFFVNAINLLKSAIRHINNNLETIYESTASKS